MNIMVQLALLVAVCLCVDAAPDGRYIRKLERSMRGVQSLGSLTSRTFGKRNRIERDVDQQPPPERNNRGTPTFKSPSVGIARDFGKRTPELDSEDEPIRKIHFNCPYLIASKYGERSDNDGLNDEEEVVRVIRGTFKPNSNILIARGYGKRQEEPTGEEEIRVARGSFNPHTNVLIARGYGKRESTDEVYGLDHLWENPEYSQEKHEQDVNENKTIESIPMDWFVNEMMNSPDFVRSVIRKFIDLNQDGMLSSEELLRNV